MRKSKLEEKPRQNPSSDVSVDVCGKEREAPEKGKSIFISAVGTRCECAWAGAGGKQHWGVSESEDQ